MNTKSAWIIGGAIVLAAAMIVGAMFYFDAQEKERRCDELRADVFSSDPAEILSVGRKLEELEC